MVTRDEFIKRKAQHALLGVKRQLDDLLAAIERGPAVFLEVWNDIGPIHLSNDIVAAIVPVEQYANQCAESVRNAESASTKGVLPFFPTPKSARSTPRKKKS